MAKVTLNVNLFPCTREVPGCAIDLSTDILLAKQLAKTATQIFWLVGGTAHFSGYTQEGDDGLSIQVWHKNRLYRTASFPSIGYSGVLFVDVTTPRLEDAIGCDFLGDLYRSEGFREHGFSMTGPHAIPRPMGTYSYRSKNRRARADRRAIVSKLIHYLETGE